MSDADSQLLKSLQTLINLSGKFVKLKLDSVGNSSGMYLTTDHEIHDLINSVKTLPKVILYV